MKNQKRFHAKNLYLNTGLSKSEIAARLRVDRKTIYLWVREGDWDRLKKSAEHVPAIIAEQCYFLIGHLTSYLLSDIRQNMPTTHKEADTIHKLALSIRKLQNRNTINESMELFTFLLEDIKKKNPASANTLLPFIESFVEKRCSNYMGDFLPEGYDQYGVLPRTYPPDNTEQRLDDETYRELVEANTQSGRSTA